MKYMIPIILLLLQSCGSDPKPSAPDFTSEVAALQTTLSKRGYLEEIFESDQEYRIKRQDPKLSQTERDQLWEKQEEADYLNLLKIEKFLELHGHPVKSEVGEIAALAPWAVIHHQNDYKTRIRFFKPLYKAWLDGNIKDNSLSFYLNRTYVIKSGVRNKMSGPYKSEDEINLLIQKLDLESKKSEVLQSRK